MHTPLHTSPIAIIGMAARFPKAGDVEQYWTNLVDGVDAISRIDGDDADATHADAYVPAIGKLDGTELFDADFFRVTPAEAVTLDPQHRVLLEVAAEALEDAGYAGRREAVVGVFVGCGENHYWRDFVAPTEVGPGREPSTRAVLGNEKDFLAARLAFKLGCTGPAITVQTGCATSLSAVALACAALAAGDCDIALAGGVSLTMPDVDGYLCQEGGVLSADGRCRAFDAGANGTVPGSGAGIVVLRRDADAAAHRDRRRAVIRGWAVNNDGGSRAGFTVPNIAGQEAVIRTALARAGMKPESVGYVETHGTGTAIGDPVEFEALRRVFATAGRPAGSLVLGAVKPSIGHTDAAAGIAGLIKATLVVERGTVPGTLHFTEPNPAFELAGTPFTVTAAGQPWSGDGPRVAGVSSFGLGGSNAHVVLESVPPAPSAEPARQRQIIALSARTDDELERAMERLAVRLERETEPDAAGLADIAYTLAVGRGVFAKRWAAVVSSHADAAAQLRGPAAAGRATTRWSLAVHGTPQEMASMGERLVAGEPMALRELRELADRTDLDGLPVSHAAGLTLAVVARTLRRIGVAYARLDAPAWARPVVQWLNGPGDAASLPAALDACGVDGDAGAAREGAGVVSIGPSFDLAQAIATAWQAGLAVNWAAYYADEARGRVPLPTYPFSRRRFWLERPQAAPSSPQAAARTDHTSSRDISRIVEAVWREVLGVDSVAPDAHFVDELGGDSMYAVEIGARLNDEFGLSLPLDLPFIAPTVAATEKFVEQALATEANK
ncbi:beta-ketoacyl synthase N-terminal-like domain-containing protein [Micromonospora haikouensis]|uniref:beta-ketoacyl synthase N-terminal-like domain-containing protein n=1 Tax=Micromonospora haikouensis TaxID=686309 RepID=UPI003D765685